MQSKAVTVQQYLAELPEERRAAIRAVREAILKNLDKDYEEGMQYGMIGYYVPHRIFPAGYHCDPRQPLPFACLASQKNHMALYMMSEYGEGPGEKWFREQWAKTGKKLDMGKCCIRFKKIEDLPLDLIAEAIRRVPVSRHVEHYESAMRALNKLATKSAESGGGTTKKASAKRAGTSAKKAKSVKPARSAKSSRKKS